MPFSGSGRKTVLFSDMEKGKQQNIVSFSRKKNVKRISSCFSEIITLDRHCRDRYVTLVPSFDIDSTIKTVADFENISQVIKELLRCFDRPQ